MKPSVIVWDLETGPDLGGFAAAGSENFARLAKLNRSEIGCLREKMRPPLFSTKQRIGDWLFRDHSSWRGARRLFRRRDHERHPGVPAIGPVLVGEFPVGFEIEITLRLSGQGNDESELRAGADDLRLEAADAIAGAAVAADLLVDIANGTDKKLFR